MESGDLESDPNYEHESDPNYEPESEEPGNEEEELEKEEEKQSCMENGKRYECNFEGCKATFNRPSRLENHMNLHKNKRCYNCTYEKCDKSYTNPSHLKRHMLTHISIATTYECKFCSANISTISNLKRHYNRAHNVEKEMFCQECSIPFRKKNRYEEHMASHRNSSLYKCDKCGKMFLTHMKLKKHHLTHIPKSYKCPIANCTEVFEKWALMVEHKKSHKPDYPCPVCDKVFSARSILMVHSKVHSENRPAIPCPYENCTRLYYFKRNLNQHIRSKHIGDRFHCDLCDLKLSTKQKIQEHMMKIHMSVKKPFKRKAQQQRKDAGQAKRSALTKLTGIQLSVSAEIHLMKRNPAALLRDKAVEESEEERAASSDVSAKGA